MKKTPSVFQRNPNNMSELLDDMFFGAEWVGRGEGTPTCKYDGTCMLLDEDYHWWMRREVKKDREDPEGFWWLGEDPTTGRRMGWVPASPKGYLHPLIEALGINTQDLSNYVRGIPGNRTEADVTTRATRDYLQAFSRDTHIPTGTYELCGPKINGNPENLPNHELIKHSDADVFTTGMARAAGVETHPATLEAARELMRAVGTLGWEGLVWHHPDGRMAKLKVRDFKYD